MADPQESRPSTSTASPLTAESETAKSKRKQYFAKRDATKVCLLGAFDRWKAVKEENRLRSDQQVAEMLLDLYADTKSRDANKEMR